MKKISVKNYGIIHHIAMCQNCDWTDAIDTEEKNRSQQLRNRVYKHIRETGHRVHVEAGTSRTYYLRNP